MAQTKITALQALQAFASDPANSAYVERFGEPIRENFEQWANGVVDFPEVQNSFLNYLINKIGRTYVNSMYAYNPLAFLRGEDLPFGSTIEDMFINITKSMAFDPDGKSTLDKFVPDVRVLYYVKNSDLSYPITVTTKEIKLAFFREGEMGALIDKIINSLYESARHDMFILLKQLMAQYDGYYHVNIPAFDDTDATAQAVGKAINLAVQYGRFDRTDFNAVGMMNNVREGEGLLVMTVAASTSLNFDYLANVFNLSKVELQSRIVIVDDFGSRSDLQVIYVDKRIFQNHFLYEGIEAQRNAQGRFTTYWLCEEAIYAMSKFMVGIAFTTSPTLEIKFNANGGTGAMPSRYGVAGVPFSLPINNFTAPEGKTFAGWALTAGAAASAALAPVTDIQIEASATSPITVYAIWK